MIEITRKEYYDMRKNAKVCVKCGKEDAYTMNGRSNCAECAEKIRDWFREYRKDPSEKERRKNRKIEHRLKMVEEGKCIRCGKKNTGPYKTCPHCLAKKRNYNRNKNHEKSATKGVTLCWQCNKEKMLPGYKLCAKCYDMKMKALEKANKVNAEIGYYKFWEGRKNKVDNQGETC